MRTIKIMAVAALVGLTACAGKDGALVRVRFEVGVDSGRIAVKSVADVLEETQPSGVVALTLEGVDVDCRAVVEVGEVVDLKAGRYHVTGKYEPALSASSVAFISDEPGYSVDAYVDVVRDGDIYYVDGSYDCFALVMDSEDTAEYLGDGSAIYGFAGSGRYQVVYMYKEAPEWVLTVVPYEDSEVNGETEYSMSGHEKGKWYCYHPGRAETSGIFGVNLPEWTEGD